MKKKVVIFIDVVSHKNQLQIESIINYGLIPDVFVSTYKASSDAYFIKGGGQTLLIKKTFERLRQVNSFLQKNKKNIHHLEIYPGDKSTFLYVLLSKFYKIKCVCVERGAILLYQKKVPGKFTRLFMELCYKFCDIVWYREPYMKPILERFNKKLFFLHNSISIHDDIKVKEPSEKKITFLWLNRIVPQRKYDWFIEALKNPELTHTVNYLVGILPNAFYKKEQEYVINNKPANLIIKEYCDDPEHFYNTSKFFVLPAEIVFANNALLEAMSFGVVPLVSDQMGSDLIVTDGVNGYIFKHTQKDFEEVLSKAFHLSDIDYKRMSLAAQENIRNDFSSEKYYKGLEQLYNLL